MGKTRFVNSLLALALLGSLVGTGCSSSNPEPEKPAPTEPTANALDAALARLVGAVQSDPFDEGAINGLISLRESSIPGARILMESDDEDVRTAGVTVAREIPTRDALNLLIASLQDPEPDVRLNAVEALGEWRNSDATQPLLEAFEREDWEYVKWEIVTSLSRIGDSESLPLFRAGVEDEHPHMRIWSVDALCRMGTPDAVSWAAKMIRDPDKSVRKNTLRNCKETLTDPAAEDTVLVAIFDAPGFEEFFLVSRIVMGPANSPEGTDLRNKLVTRALEELAADGVRQERAAFILGELGDRRSLPQLQKSPESTDPWYQHNAAVFMRRMPDPGSVAPLIELLQSPSPLVAGTAYDSLLSYAEAGDPAAIEATNSYQGAKPASRLSDFE